MHVERFSVTLVTDGAGAATGYTDPVNGLLSQIRYVKDSFDDGVDVTITLDDTGETLWAENNVNASATRAPRQATHSTAGVAATYDGTRPANDMIAVAGRIKVVIASGGATKSGTFHFVTV